MLDPKFVREHLKDVERALKNRGQEISLDEYRRREAERRHFLTRLEELRHERNTLSKEVGALMQAGKRDEASLGPGQPSMTRAKI
jgi:seryl-tRNA synthetase